MALGTEEFKPLQPPCLVMLLISLIAFMNEAAVEGPSYVAQVTSYYF